ncbi:MAG: L-histidine N(alpha)-methyltransferase [Bermanella sp.]
MQGRVQYQNEQADEGLYFYDFNVQSHDQKQEILTGLKQSPKTISAKYFYDQQGSKLFEAITCLPEYYPTRTEINLLRQYQQQILERAGEQCLLIEYGSGASTKIRLLLDALKPKAYVPLDISKDFLFACAVQLRAQFPWLEIHATCLDYHREATLPAQLPRDFKRVAFFPGSSLGNFTPSESLSFLRGVRATVGDEGALLIGVDLVKDKGTLNAAYNDVQGVTAQFNLNILSHLNHLGDGNFNAQHFSHEAFFNEQESRIEMHLRSDLDQMVYIFGEHFVFKAGESIVTEYSYKFVPQQFERLARDAGFVSHKMWCDAGKNFALFWLEAEG